MSFMNRAAKPWLICMALAALPLLSTAAQATGYMPVAFTTGPLTSIAGSVDALRNVARSLAVPTCLSVVHC